MFVKVRSAARQVGYLAFTPVEGVKGDASNGLHDYGYRIQEAPIHMASGKDKGEPLVGGILKSGTTVLISLGVIKARKNEVLIVPNPSLALVSVCPQLLIPPQDSLDVKIRVEIREDIGLDSLKYLFALYAIA
jgi:hypothetical protein